MSTEAQLLANRLNAQKSTGPRTDEGKAAISQNATIHGLTASRDVISSESQDEFNLYRDQLLAELNPASPVESMLAERIVALFWRLKRIGCIQNQAIDALNADNNTPSPLAKLTQSLFPKGLSRPQDGTSVADDTLALGRMAIKDFSNTRVLERLLMYERRIEHSLHKTLLEIQRLNLVRNLKGNPETPLNQSTQFTQLTTNHEPRND